MKKDDRLDSWKEIAEYINRNIRTCIRWEKKFGLPVYRIDKNSSHSKVFSFKTEIDQWFEERAEL